MREENKGKKRPGLPPTFKNLTLTTRWREVDEARIQALTPSPSPPPPPPTKKKTGRRRFPDPFETSSSAAAAAAAPPSATLQKAKEQSGHPCLSTKDAYSSFSRVAGPPIDAERLAAAAAGPPLSATVVAEVAGGPLSGRRVRPPPFDDEGGDGGKGKDGPFRPRVPAAAGREESSEALLREVRARHGGC